MERKTVSRKVFKTPFCREYWHLAVAEFKDTKMIVFAALILALRIAVKPLSIPIAADLKEGIGFIINAFGSMIYGPVVALLNGALSDTLGYLLFPSGVYFPAYMITEMAGSFVFALFLYRAEITVPRLLLCRFAICLGVNVILSYPIHVWYYSVVMGKAYSMALIRVVKNIALFPIETVILVIIFRALIPPFQRLGYIYSGTDRLEFTKKNIILLICLFVIFNFVDSRAGRAVAAQRDNFIATESVGINITKYKLTAFTISAGMAGMAGTLFALNYSTVVASKFDFNTSILVLVFVVLGGLGNMKGSIIAAIVLTLLPELLRAFSTYRMLLYAVVLIIIMLITNNPEMKHAAETALSWIKGLFGRKKGGAVND